MPGLVAEAEVRSASSQSNIFNRQLRISRQEEQLATLISLDMSEERD